MSISVTEAREALKFFVGTYPEANSLAFVIGNTVDDVYGKNEAIRSHISNHVKGGHVSGKWEENGIVYNGRVDLILNNHANIRDFNETLRHEILGHYGLNTFNEKDRNALLDSVIETQNEPAFKKAWEIINDSYPEASTKLKAEELICFVSEFVEPEHHLEKNNVKEQGDKAFKETCIDHNRSITMKDIHSIVCMVAQGLHEKSRTLETMKKPLSEKLKDLLKTPEQKEFEHEQTRGWRSSPEGTVEERNAIYQEYEAGQKNILSNLLNKNELKELDKNIDNNQSKQKDRGLEQ